MIRFTTFPDLESAFAIRETRMRTDNNELILYLQDALVESFKIMDKIHQEFTKDYKRTGIELDKVINYHFSLYIRNCHYLYAAYINSCLSLNNPALSILRSVYESILKIYFIHLYPIKGKRLVETEINAKTLKDFLDLHKQMRIGDLRTQLYNTKSQNDNKDLYNVLSQRSHALIKSAASDWGYNKETSEDTLKMVLSMIFANIMAIWEVLCDGSLKNHEKQINDALINIAKGLGSAPSITPNHLKIKSKIKIQPYE